jgi:hypothetical protein
MTSTYKGSVLSTYIKDLLTANRNILSTNDRHGFGFDAIFYGDQRVLVVGRTVCVEPTIKRRKYNETGMRMETRLQTGIIVYCSSDQGQEIVQLTADQLCESIEDLLNTHASPKLGDRFGGLIDSGWVSDIEHGYRIPAAQTTRANRIVFTAISRQALIEVD